ncbi:MAG: ABC transporter permease [Bryobacteraceae bacterium]
MRMNHWIYTLPLRLRSLFRRRQVEQELDEELQYHLERKIEEALAQGLTPEAARRTALLAMNGVDQRKEECRDMRGVNGIENLFRDLRFGLRALGKSPGFTAVAILTLALGIGANTAIFSVVNSVLLRPLPYPAPERLVQVMLRTPQGDLKNLMSIPRFAILRGQTQAFEEVVAYDSRVTGLNLTGVGDPEQLKTIHVSADYFRLFATEIGLGRPFSVEEDGPGGPRLVVLSDGLWRRRFGADPGLVGKAILLEGEPYVVTGVMGARFTADPPVDVWLPLNADPNSTNGAHSLRVASRLKPGITLEMAKAQMKLAEDQFAIKFPGSTPGAFTLELLQDVAVGDVRPGLLVLLGAVSLVLLIACANVANLLLARANGRTREMAIRSALGASRRRIICQLLAESLLLSLAGGLLGLFVGSSGLRALLALNMAKLPRLGVQGSALALDWRVLGFTLLISVFSAILFALLPAFKATRGNERNALQESGSRSGNSVHHGRVRSTLVITEMAMAVVLLAGAILLVRTFVALRSVDPGFRTKNVLTMEMSLKEKRFEKTAAVAQLIQDAERRAATIAGVTALATTASLPLEPNFHLYFDIEGRPVDLRNRTGADYRPVSPRYFDVFGISLRRGRLFTDHDDFRAPGVVVINEAMAKQFWPSENPVGKRITIGAGTPAGSPFYEPARQIVGVVADVRDRGLNKQPDAIMYVPVAQLTDGLTALGNQTAAITWVVSTKAEPHSFSAALQRELRAASGGLPVARIRSMEQVSAESVGLVNFNMTLLSIFAAMAMLLAAIGIYGVMSSSVQQQTREISLRMVLGAESRAVRNTVVWQGMRLALTGVGLGACLSFALTPLMASLLYGVKATDPAVPLLVGLILSGVALLATYIPARRATLIDPLVALRWE